MLNAKVSPPREGLPPCLRMTQFDGRMASLRDASLCDARHRVARFYVARGQYRGVAPSPNHEGSLQGLYTRDDYDFLDTDSEAGAEVYYARACEWVLIGELP